MTRAAPHTGRQTTQGNPEALTPSSRPDHHRRAGSDRRTGHNSRMDPAKAQALADGYAAYITVGDLSVLRMFSPDFYDNVSKQSGLSIFTVVGGWLEESFAERQVELNLVTHTD